MKKAATWLIVLAILSGWVAFGVQYVVSREKIATLEQTVTELETEIGAFDILKKNVDSSVLMIDDMITSLQHLKQNLGRITRKLEKE